MATRVDATGDYLQISSGVLDYNAAYTVAAWVRPAQINSAFHGIFALTADATSANNDSLVINSSNQLSGFSYIGGGGGSFGSGATIVQDVWVHLALVRSSTDSLRMMVNGVTNGSDLTTYIPARTAAGSLMAGAYPWNTAQHLNGRMACMKAWTAALSEAELLAEMRIVRPARLANIWGWWPMFEGQRTQDYGPNRKNWTENGTLTDEQGPPVAWGA